MRLKEVQVESYRSITQQLVPINHSCIGLVGLNESGKSNILQAIRMLDDGFSVTIKDKSKINNSLPKVKYSFEISKEMSAEAEKYCQAALANSQTIPYASIAKNLTIKQYDTFRQLTKEKETYKKTKTYSCDYSIIPDDSYFCPKDQVVIPPDISVEIGGRSFPLAKIQIVKKGDIPESAMQFFEPATTGRIKILLGPFLSQFFGNRIPQVIFWQYDVQYLLPSEITYTDFIKNDEPYTNCVPLYNIFMLSGRLKFQDQEGLITRISEWKTDASLRRRDANIITDDLNSYIKRIWPDYDQEIKVELEESKITVHIFDPNSKDCNFYEMESRSQGFKTFISFMLTTAAEIETDQINNCILLLDEPETHLHPSGARFMRDELLKLSKNNYVIFATHSIFMIDRANISRHLIVRKNFESTKISIVDRNNFIQESVIYEALGTRVDEFSIRNKNIIFEGSMDLILFNYLINECVSKRNNHLLEYELHDAGGTKNITAFFKNKQIPKESEWIVLLDNDTPGKNIPSDLRKVCLDPSNIHCYFYSSEDGKELEDVLPELFIKEAISRTEALLGLSPTFGFILDTKKTIARNVDEYKHRNSFEIHPDFEASFKSMLTDIIKEQLAKIKETTINKKLAAFKDMFPNYFLAVRNIIEEKGVKFSDES